jgi:peptidoglycan/xylan/chitin deacetylase (PgdA/CDA1 family)
MVAQPARDLVGYGADVPTKPWPNGARLAINIVVNYEEGSERSFAMGDPDQEALSDWGAYRAPSDIRDLAVESVTEYGSRVAIWRLLRLFDELQVKSTFFACAVAFEQNPQVAKATVAAGHEICSHGWRWEEVFKLTEDEERAHIDMALDSFEKTTGVRPVGWYCRYGPSERTRRLIAGHGNFLYDSDAYNDDCPYFADDVDRPAPADHRPPRPDRWAAPVHRAREAVPRCLVRHPRGDCAGLAHHARLVPTERGRDECRC